MEEAVKLLPACNGKLGVTERGREATSDQRLQEAARPDPEVDTVSPWLLLLRGGRTAGAGAALCSRAGGCLVCSRVSMGN